MAMRHEKTRRFTPSPDGSHALTACFYRIHSLRILDTVAQWFKVLFILWKKYNNFLTTKSGINTIDVKS